MLGLLLNVVFTLLVILNAAKNPIDMQFSIMSGSFTEFTLRFFISFRMTDEGFRMTFDNSTMFIPLHFCGV